MILRRALVLLCVCVLARRAHAQLPEQVVIEWSDDASCPRPLRISLESEIARLLGPRASTNPEPLAFEVHIERTSENLARPYLLSLSVRRAGQRAERQVELTSCAEAQDAAALLIATAIDPDAALRAPPTAPPAAPPAAVADRPEPAKPANPEPESHAPAVKPQRWSLLARALFDLSSLPHPTGGGSAGALYARERVRVWAEARYLFARRISANVPGSSLGADVDLFGAAVGGSYVWPFGQLVLGPAAELELGALRARGARGSAAGSAKTLSGVGPWGAAELGAIAGYGVDRRVGLELALYMGLPLRRPRLALRDEPAFYTTYPVTMRVAVGLRVSLGSL